MGILNLFNKSNQQNKPQVSNDPNLSTGAVQQQVQTTSTTQGTQMYDGITSPPQGVRTTDGIMPPSPPPNVISDPAVQTNPSVPTSQNNNQNIPPSVPSTSEDKTLPSTPSAKPDPKKDKLAKKSNMDIMTRLTQRSNRALAVGAQKAQELKSSLVDSEHLLLGLLADQEIFNLLSSLKMIPQEISNEILKNLTSSNTKNKPQKVDNKPQLAPRVKKILEDALIVARKLGYEFISPEHILYALYNEGEGLGARVLSKMGLNKDELNIKILGKKKGLDESGQKAEKKQSALERFSRDLTAKAANGELDPVVERAPVIERVIHILSRRNKNNPVLIGEAGVGKTAVVEGLASKIVSKEVPETLLNKKILELDLMAMLAGASKRGEFEERLKLLLDELKESQGKVVLFIDEIHNIVGAGASGDGAGDAANIIKPALARGEIQTIGATTTSEYKKYIEKDPALERRFQPVIVPEPTEDQAIKMLRAVRDKYEAFHKVKIPDEVVDAAVKLSKRYVGGRFLPDKAIDLIDESASAVRLPVISLPEEIKSTEDNIKVLQQEKQEALKIGNNVKANIYEKRIIDSQDELKQKQEEYKQKKAMSVGTVSLQLIKDVIARWTGIPVNKISESEKDKVIKLEDIMHEKLVDQENAVKSVAQAIRRGRAGLKSTKRPIGSFIFLGPTGVGKTELVKILSEILFGTEDSMLRFDMTEYMEKHEVAKLLGAPPGYVGYEEGGKLTESVKRKPYSVVLFDEIEKAHPDIFNILLQILDDGRLTDNKGHTISFKNTVVICTSNIGSHIIQKELMKQSKDQIEEPVSLNTYSVSPRGREMLIIGNKTFSKNKEDNEWIQGFIKDYFAGQKVLEIDNEGKAKEAEFDSINIMTQTISPQGVEIITNGEDVYIRKATTAKEWQKTKLVDYFKNNVVINTLPDTPNEQLPTVKLATHAFTPQEEEIVTYKNRLWKRKIGKNEWETFTLVEYLKGAKTKNNKPLPMTYWNIHLFDSNGQEIIIVGDNMFTKTSEGWETKLLKDSFGKGSPLEQELSVVKKMEDDSSIQKYAGLKKRIMEEVLKFMRPELVNRFDETIVFEPLKYEHMLKIVKLQLKSVNQLLEEQTIGLQVSEMAEKEIVREGFDPVFGARPLRRAIQKLLENPISELIIAGKVAEGDVIIVDFDGEKLTFEVAKAQLASLEKGEKKTFICKACQHRFETVVFPHKSTAICAQCGKEFLESVDSKNEPQQSKQVLEKSVPKPPQLEKSVNGNGKLQPMSPRLATL